MTTPRVTVTVEAGTEVTVEHFPATAPAPPPPPPPPAPAPVPAPPPEGSRPADVSRTINLLAVLNFDEWGGDSRYDRWQNLTELSGTSASLSFSSQNLAGGGNLLPLLGSEYTLTVDGVPAATVRTVPGVTTRATFVLALGSVAPGWHVLDILGAEGSSVPWPVMVLGGPAPDWMPVCTGSKEILSGIYMLKWVPSKFAPTELPLPPRSYTMFLDARPRAQLSLEQLVIHRMEYVRRTNRSKAGTLNTFARQWYAVWDMTTRLPKMPLLDGPRGRACIGYPTHLQVSRAIVPELTGPNPIPTTYFCDPWSFGKIKSDGTVIRLAGWRHKEIPTYWEDPPELELVGDWSAIPAERHGFHETWGACLDSATLEIDLNAPVVPEVFNLHPHKVGVKWMIADSQNNRICQLEFDPRSHVTPCRVTEFLTGLQDPWDVVEWKNSFIVSERNAHRIAQYSKAGTLERVIISGLPLSIVQPETRLVQRLASLATIVAQPCVGPEGLYVLDDWLYFGSAAMDQVRRIHLETGALEVVVPQVGQGGGSDLFVKIAVSDGTFGPRHAVFTSNWSNGAFGMPYCYLPGGGGWSLATYTGAGSLDCGPGGDWEVGGYSGAVGVGAGRLITGGAGEGIRELRATPPGTPSVDRVMRYAGRKEWFAKGYHLLHDDTGFGFYGLPLPWGESTAMDYYLTTNGHIKPSRSKANEFNGPGARPPDASHFESRP